MKDFNDYLETALKFHGHKCPAMPMGLRAAMAALGVEQDSGIASKIKVFG